MNKFLLVTTPIFYPNAKPHIGHLFTAIWADYVKRAYQLKGYQVKLSTGTDEHGAKIMKTAAAQGYKNPKELCDINSTTFKTMMDKASVSYDCFTRTTDRTAFLEIS